MTYIIIGNTVAEWNEEKPHTFTLTEDTGTTDDKRERTISIDFQRLIPGFEDEFIFALRDHLLERRNRVSLTSVETEAISIRNLLLQTIEENLFDQKIALIDSIFLLALGTIKEKVSHSYLDCLRRSFKANAHSKIFAANLRATDFPVGSSKKGAHGRRIDAVLAKALTRSACIEILRRTEEAYEAGLMDIGHFSFVNLAFSVYARPDSYRRIRLTDLVYDTDADSFFLHIPPAKSGSSNPNKIPYRINKHAGVLLQAQRQSVVKTYGHIVGKENIPKLSLFPARRLNEDKTAWLSAHANRFYGELPNSSSFLSAYPKQISERFIGEVKGHMSMTNLRHTVGTQLAEAGCSAKTIQAVLKHASDKICRAYVDIAFHGLINVLSDAMQPAFEEHLPAFDIFRSKTDSIPPEKKIHSENLESGRTELTGECGKDIRCEAAPLTCYECFKFIPCFDADHSINLEIAQNEVDRYVHAGKPYQHHLDKAKNIKIRIHLVMAACDRYQQSQMPNN